MAKKITIDGNTDAGHIAYAFSDVAAIYPITPWMCIRDRWDHVEWVCKEYKKRRDRMLSLMPLLHAKYTVPMGGLFIWGEFQEGKNALSLLEQAIERKVAFIPGTHFYTNGGHENTFRLNFSNASLEKIDQGMRILADVVS